ncbi:MAG: hypothetical protein CAPSK01_001587 [Candidatus Accumulibacter vicinus]|uniref:Uncharacterized protein n=1 Tax=Candidatus Accumulibacter vicinus TaxID=2954382 RepID=A0A084Y1Y9_9PROT|nr:MAG: hypothetical protein CAPSK01_001587 [Candidatus Accumulibacter vicinus]
MVKYRILLTESDPGYRARVRPSGAAVGPYGLFLTASEWPLWPATT